MTGRDCPGHPSHHVVLQRRVQRERRRAGSSIGLGRSIRIVRQLVGALTVVRKPHSSCATGFFGYMFCLGLQNGHEVQSAKNGFVLLPFFSFENALRILRRP